jgi:hypothetical protein
MRHCLLGMALAALLIASISAPAFSQGSANSSLSGVVMDQSGGVVPGAEIMVKNDATGAEYKAISADNGTFSIPSLSPGTYTATVTMANFKQAVYKEIKLVAGTPGNLRVTLQVGGSNEVITVQAGAEVVQTQSATISTTMAVNQITNLPLATRNALDFMVLLPGANTTGGSRGTTFNGLPNNAIAITIDGINTQDNYLKGSSGGDGFFSMISPRLDAIEEVTVSSATPGAESAGQGAVQIKFVTRSGNNDYHGSLYEYHRNPSLNSNYWFNNRDKTPWYVGDGPTYHQPCTTAQMQTDFENCKAPRDRVLFNQFGGRVGGPISIPKLFSGKDKAFFFANYEEFRLPAQTTRTRTVFSPGLDNGIFPYTVGSTVQTVDLLALAAANGQTATFDPTVKKLLTDIRASTGQGTVKQQSNPAYMDFLVTNTNLTIRRFLTTRFDFNLTSQHRLEVSYSYHRYVPVIDFLNSRDPIYPGFPNYGTQGSNRFTVSTALRSTITPRLVNEARFGLIGGITLFFPDVNSAMFQTSGVGNQDGYGMGISSAGINNPHSTTSPSRRNAPDKTFEDSLTWTKGTHSISFGGTWTNVSLFLWSQQVVPTISFGVDTTFDPAAVMFNSTNGPKNFPGASSTQYGSAQSIYAVLTGRVTAIGGNGVLNENTNQYTYNGENVQRGHMQEIGLYVSDSWRMRPNLTLNYGVRWEVQFPFSPGNNVYTINTIDDLWGLSGPRTFGGGKLYTPGNTTGVVPTYKQFSEGDSAYNTRYRDFAPTVGFAWTPGKSGSAFGKILGENGQTVIRGGFSIAFNRNGMSDYSSMYGANPGITINATRNVSNGNLVSGTGTDVWPLLFRDKSRLGQPSFISAPTYPLQSTSISDQVNLFDPNTRTPYTMSWTFGLQREITKSMALEVRYVGNKNLQGWTQRNINEQNLVENGFLDEFKLAMANLQSNLANGRGSSFKYFGPGTGTSPLPITLAHFSGLPASQAGDATKYTSSNFSSSTYVNTLAKYNANPGSYASNLWSSATQRSNATAAGLPSNLFVVNPTVASGGAWISTNGGYNRYNSMVVELRRRMSKGLLVQASYAYAQAINGSRLSYRVPYVNVTGDTLPHAFKINWVYEMPLGKGKALFTDASSVVNHFIGGWEFQGTGRWQSGNLLNFGNVRLVGMTLKELQDAVGLRFDDVNKQVYYEPNDILTNTIAAFNTSATSSTGYSSSFGVPTGRYIAPASQQDCIQIYSGQCAGVTTYVRGPEFFRMDLSVVKRIRFTETKNFEFRGEFLNAFNNINFFGTTCASSSQTCGRVTSAYTDPNQQQDPGGRLIQFVLRFNF